MNTAHKVVALLEAIRCNHAGCDHTAEADRGGLCTRREVAMVCNHARYDHPIDLRVKFCECMLAHLVQHRVASKGTAVLFHMPFVKKK